MGETAADTRVELERTREDLGEQIDELRVRGGRLKERAVRAGTMAGAALAGVVVVAGGTVLAVIVVRRRRGGALTRAARNLPEPLQRQATPAARWTEGWLDGRRRDVQQRRDELADALAERIVAAQAQAERKANPMWRRAAIKGFETAATVGTAALARRVLPQQDGREAATEREVAGRRQRTGDLVAAGAG